MNRQGAPSQAPVIIVGGGPVGLVLAMNLHALRVRTVVVNTETSVRRHPKGSTHNARTMEHYRRLGIAGSIRRLGLPPEHPTDVGYFTRLSGWELARVAMLSEADKMRAVRGSAATDQTPEPLLRCNQMYVEPLLLEHARTLDGVELRFGSRCTAWKELPDGVSVDVEEVATGRRETLHGAFLAGCDGGQSFVRKSLGIRYAGQPLGDQPFFGGGMVATYLRAPELYHGIIKKPCWQYWVVNPSMRGALFTLDGKGEFLLLTKLKAGDEQPDEAAIARHFTEMVGQAVPVELIGHWPWTAGLALVAERFGAGRVQLAGDAVHLFTPTGGFGMNTGIDDAANLAWKLAAMVRGWGGPGLLPSYELERHPIALRNTSASRALAKSVGAVPVSPAIELDGPEGIEARQTTGDFVRGFIGEEFASMGIQLGARYDSSPIVVSDGTAAPPDSTATYVPSACPGGRAPHVWLGAGRELGDSLFDRFGRGFTLLRFGPADAGPLQAAAHDRRVPLTVLDLELPAARQLYERALVLVRPDQHVAWRGDRLPADCNALLATVTGW
jgi:2-polyprenyl-6-methoxyphenol hydroxylase-like FAD-dependent oxidoreductase